MTRKPLSRFPLLHSGDLAKLRDAVDGMTNYGHAVTRVSHHSQARYGVVNGVQVNSVSLAYVSYATPAKVFAPPTGDLIVVVIPLGRMHVEVAGTGRMMTKSFILPSAVPTRMTPDPEAGALVGAVPTEIIIEILEASFGTSFALDLDLSSSSPVTVNAEHALRRSWLTQAWQDERPDADHLLESLTVGLGTATRYRRNASSTVQSLPPYLLATVQYLRSHFADSINLSDLSSTMGISARQLQIAFRMHMGLTPNEYLRNVRLDAAHSLLRSSNAKRVADVAVEVGIPHLGRFARYFTRRFGVRPSELGR